MSSKSTLPKSTTSLNSTSRSKLRTKTRKDSNKINSITESTKNTLKTLDTSIEQNPEYNIKIVSSEN